MKKLISKIKAKGKYLAGLMSVAAVSAVSMISACAEDTEVSVLDTYSSQIIDQFTDAADSIVPIVVGVLGAGLGIFVIFLGIKLGKKMFNTVAK